MKYVVLILASVLFLNRATANPFFYRASYKKIRGFAITVRQDTIKGYFFINYYKGILYNEDIHQKNAFKTDSVIKQDQIQSIFLELPSKKVLNQNGLTEYTYLHPYNKIFRKIYAGKNVYYDGNTNSFNIDKVFNVLVIADGGGEKNMILLNDNAFKSAKSKLTDYLNGTYGTQFSSGDFQDPMSVILEIEKHR